MSPAWKSTEPRRTRPVAHPWSHSAYSFWYVMGNKAVTTAVEALWILGRERTRKR